MVWRCFCHAQDAKNLLWTSFCSTYWTEHGMPTVSAAAIVGILFKKNAFPENTSFFAGTTSSSECNSTSVLISDFLRPLLTMRSHRNYRAMYDRTLFIYGVIFVCLISCFLTNINKKNAQQRVIDFSSYHKIKIKKNKIYPINYSY